MRQGLRIGRLATSSDSVGGRTFWTPPANSSFVAKILCDADHIVSGTFCHYRHGDKELTWVYSGDGDPCEKLDFKPRFSLVIPMIVKQGDAKLQRNVRFPPSVMRQVEALSVTYPTIAGLIVNVSRVDGQFAKYELVSTGKYAKADEFDQDAWLRDLQAEFFEGEPSEIVNWLASQGVEKFNASSSKVTMEDF